MAPKRGRLAGKDIDKELEAQLAVFSRGGGDEAARSREEVREAILDRVSGSDRMKLEIEQLSNEAQSVAKMKKLVANQLRNARRRQARLKTKARNLTVQDLMDCISMHKEAGKKTKGKGRTSGATGSGGASTSGSPPRCEVPVAPSAEEQAGEGDAALVEEDDE